MKKQNLILILIFAVIVGFMIWLTWRNEKQHNFTPLPEEKINIKQPPAIVVPVDNATQGKG